MEEAGQEGQGPASDLPCTLLAPGEELESPQGRVGALLSSFYSLLIPPGRVGNEGLFKPFFVFKKQIRKIHSFCAFLPWGCLSVILKSFFSPAGRG